MKNPTHKFLEQEIDKQKYVTALERVEAFLQAHVAPGLTAKIHDYTERGTQLAIRPWANIRVAEVWFYKENYAASYIQSDVPYGLAVCAQVERCILAYIEDWDRDGGWRRHVEFDRLAYLLENDRRKVL